MSILTINKDGTPSYNEVNYVLHELEDSRIKRHILSGIITDMEVSDIGAKNTNCRVRYKNQSVLIPISEMGIELSNNDNGDEWVRKTQILSKMLGAVVDFIVRGIDRDDPDDIHIVASRADALRKKRFEYFTSNEPIFDIEKYDKAEANVEKISETLEQHQVRLLKDSAMMDKMYEQNLLYFKELSMYIQAGKLSLSRMRDGKLKELEEKAKITGLPEDAQAAKDLDSKCARFEKKLHDLELTRMISLQTAPQIRLVQNNDTMMAEKIQTTLVNTIPLWKSQMVLALGIAHSTEAAQAQSQVSDLTNELLRKNAEKLHMASVETAKESERGIVDMETLQKTNADLIQTLDDVMKIQREGREKRQAAEAEMLKMENDLKVKLLEIQH